MKIAVYSHSIAPSIDGVCRRFTGILHEMARQGHSTMLFTLEQSPQNIPKDTVIVTVDHMFFPSYPDKKVARVTLNSCFTIYNALKQFKPDVLHVVADGISQVFEWAALMLGIPIVASYHTDIIDLIKSHDGFIAQQAMVMYKEAGDTWVLDSAATTSVSFQRKLKRQCVPTEHIIHTAVDCTIFSPARRSQALRRELMFGDENGFLLVYAGRLSTEKRIEVLLRGLEIMRQQPKINNRQIYLALIGDGPSANKYALQHGVERGIYCKPRFLDHWELGEVYASSDLHVSGSVFETLGNTVLEAFACSIPVVVPNTQGFQDTVKHGEDGFLFPPGDEQALVTYVTQLRQDDSLRASMGQRARRDMEVNNQIENVVQDLTRWYQHGIKKRQERSQVQIALSLIFLMLNLPISITAFNIYNFLVNFVLKRFYPPGKGDKSH